MYQQMSQHLHLQVVSFFSPTNTITNSPTISGSTGTQVPVIDYYIKSPDNSQYYKVSSITMPSGAGLNFFPLPMAQIG